MFPNSNPVFKYISIDTKEMGEFILEMIYCNQIKDLINSFSIISNGLSMIKAKGALITPFVAKSNKKLLGDRIN